MIEVKNLTKRYGDHIAVNKLSFEIGEGKIYGFLGPNGAGKSTTMNILTGYLASSGGTVLINGVDMQKEPEKAKEQIGYLPEIPPLYVDMQVEEYLAFVAELKKLPKKNRKEEIERVMEKTFITDMRKRLIKNLSKGYKQRVGLAQAILGNPKIIILDEPTVGLDPKQIIEIRDLIRELGKEHTVILSSHILSEVSAVCDQIMIISKGKLVASDSPEGLQEKMEKNAQLQLTVATKLSEEKFRESILPEIMALPGVESAELKAEPEKEWMHMTLQVDKKADIRKDLFFLLAKKELPIMELHLSEKSLEDIFLELTDPNANEEEEPAVSEETHTPETQEESAETITEDDIKSMLKQKNEEESTGRDAE